jgi:gluconolactonase
MMIKSVLLKRLPVYLLIILTITACKQKAAERKLESLESGEQSTNDALAVERLDPRLDEIIAPGIVPEIIADGFNWSEGPLWLPDEALLIFSDIPENTVYQWSELDGLKVYLNPSGYTDTLRRGGETGSNGLLRDPSGRLVLCQHGDRRMARMDAPLDNPESRFITLADKWQGKRFNSPNDAVYNSKGELYFTDPAYGMELRWEDPKREIDFAGVYKLNKEGEVELLIDSIPAPNGIGLSPDETRLYVASSGEDASLYEYRLAEDGSLSDGKVFFNARELKKNRKGSPDGLVVRGDGIIFASGPGGILIFTPEAEHLGTILTGQATSNCTLNADDSFLYMTADMYLMRIRLR